MIAYGDLFYWIPGQARYDGDGELTAGIKPAFDFSEA
jgi:hypothetical protein